MAWKRKSRVPDEPIDEDPRSYLLRALAARPYSRAQLTQKLRERGHAPESIDEALRSLSEAGLFREDDFASARVRAFVSKGRGPSWIKAKLRSERVDVDDALIDAAYEHLGVTEADQVRKLVRKALASSKTRAALESDERGARSKIVQSIVAKGHAPALAIRIANAWREFA